MLPLREHCLVLGFVRIYLSLVLEFRQFSGSLLEHLLLEVSPLDAVFLIHLLKDIHLMVLPGCSLLGGTSFVFSTLLLNGRFDLSFLVLLEPISLLLPLLLQKYIIFSRCIDILQ